jgi:predicted GNAT superfamily acetyltransferase
MPEFRYVVCDVFTDRPLEVDGAAERIGRVEVGGAAVTVAPRRVPP